MLKIFAHRGYVYDNKKNNHFQENSILSLKNAVKNGFKAIEFDIWLYNSELILSHDNPANFDAKKLANFIDFLKYGNDLQYWLDFKNINENNVDEIIHKVKQQIDLAKIDLKQFLFAPYCVNYRLSEKIFNKFHNIFGSSLHFVAVADNVDQLDSLLEFVKKNNIKYISIDYKLINKNLINKFSGIEFLAWTVNNALTIEKLSKIGVKYFASDKIIDI